MSLFKRPCAVGTASERRIDAARIAPMIPSEAPMGDFSPYHESSHIIFNPTKTRTAASP
jgi:hypothetical protein